MKFDVKCVREFLLKNGFVFTVRSYEYNDNFCTFNNTLYKRILIKRVIYNTDLSNFCEYSGFTMLSEWWRKILEFCSGKNKYLYLVVIDNDNRM